MYTAVPVQGTPPPAIRRPPPRFHGDPRPPVLPQGTSLSGRSLLSRSARPAISPSHLRPLGPVRLPRSGAQYELVAAALDRPDRADEHPARWSGVARRGMDNNILTQIGLIVLVGLAAKNAILIVEFARQAEGEGKSPSGSGGGAADCGCAHPHDVFRLHPRRRSLVIATGPGARCARRSAPRSSPACSASPSSASSSHRSSTSLSVWRLCALLGGKQFFRSARRHDQPAITELRKPHASSLHLFRFIMLIAWLAPRRPPSCSARGRPRHQGCQHGDKPRGSPPGKRSRHVGDRSFRSASCC